LLGDVSVRTQNFLQLVDLVLDDNRKQIEINRDFVEQVRAKYER
jgi:hypothetical protein